MHFDFCFDCINEGDSSKSIADIFNIVIALINLSLVVYIFRHQRLREKDERTFQKQTKSKEFRHNWFKEIIILPNTVALNLHFKKVEEIIEKLKASNLTAKQKNSIDKNLKAEFRYFSKEFIEVLFAVDRKFANQIQDISDKCLEKLQLEIYNPSKSFLDEINFQSIIIDNIKTYRNTIISKIYTFEDYMN